MTNAVYGTAFIIVIEPLFTSVVAQCSQEGWQVLCLGGEFPEILGE